MRIAFVSAATPYRGGIAQFSDALAAELDSRGHSLRMFTFSRQYPSFLFPGKTQLKQGAVEVPAKTALTIDTINPLSWFSTARQIGSFAPDLVIINFWMPFMGPAFGTIARSVKKKTQAHVVFICHNIVPHESRPGDRILTRYAIRYADSTIVLSSTVEKDLVDVWPDAKPVVAHHPVYDVYGPPIPREEAQVRLGVNDGPVILFFGIVRKYKGLDTLLQALPAIIQQTGAHLFVVGEFYDKVQPYLNTMRVLGLEQHVTIVDRFVADEEVGQYFCAADVVVLPYRSATQSGVVQIASHFDRACIVTDTGGLPEMVRHETTGFVVPVDDVAALAESVVRFFVDRRQREFEDAVRTEKGSASWSGLAEIVEDLAANGPAR